MTYPISSPLALERIAQIYLPYLPLFASLAESASPLYSLELNDQQNILVDLGDFSGRYFSEYFCVRHFSGCFIVRYEKAYFCERFLGDILL